MLFGVFPVWPVGKKKEKWEKPFTERKSARLTESDMDLHILPVMLVFYC